MSEYKSVCHDINMYQRAIELCYVFSLEGSSVYKFNRLLARSAMDNGLCAYASRRNRVKLSSRIHTYMIDFDIRLYIARVPFGCISFDEIEESLNARLRLLHYIANKINKEGRND